MNEFAPPGQLRRWAARYVNAMTASTLKIAVMLLSLGVSLSATPRADKPEKGVKVTGTVVTKKCFPWNKNLAELRLRFQFTNDLGRPLILNKSDLEIITIKYFAFIDEKTDKVHLGELAVERLRGYMPEYDREIIGARPNNHFVILRTGQSYVMETTESVPLIAASSDGATKPDEYQIALELATWVNHAPTLADSLRRRWARFGMLWSQAVWSEPVKFVFPRNRTCEP